MYHPVITAQMVDAANAALRAHCLATQQEPWELEYHSQAEIDYAISHLNAIRDPESGELTRPLNRDEARFIENEQTLCALDFRGYWLPHYAYIIDWKKQPSHFVPNVAQNIVMDLWADSEVQGHAIWMLQLKARRLGVSTISELNICHRFQFQEYSNCVVASADPDKTVEMALMIRFALEQQPWWLRPRVTKVSKMIPAEHGDLHSTLQIQAGNQFNGVARGSSPNVVHLSELCEWQSAEELVDGALLPAIIDSPDVFGILESTAKGPGWWQRKWAATKRWYPQGRSRIRPVFLPWYVGTDIYPSPADLRKRPIPPDWLPSDRTIMHAERARQYVINDPLLFTYLAKGDLDWQMPREQMWYRELGYEQAKEEKALHVFLAEYCSDDLEAFQSSNIPVVDPEVLLNYQERTRNPIAVYTIIGPDIPPALVTNSRYYDSAKPTITINTRDVMPKFDVKYQLIPLKFDGYPNFDESMKLLVWEYPDPAYSYGIGVDCAEGLGLDNTVMEVLRESTPIRPPGQVAEWASNMVTAFQVWPLVCAVGCWYSVYSAKHQRQQQTKLAIESWTNGSSIQNELQKRGWANFHAWKYNDKRRPQADGETALLGIRTNSWFRASMMDMLLTALSEEAIDFPSPYLINELTTLEKAVGSSKPEAATDAHDDRVMAIGFPLFSLHLNKPPAQQFARQRVTYMPGLTEDAAIAHPIWTPPTHASSVITPKMLQTAHKLEIHRGLGARERRYGLGRSVNIDLPERYR